MKFNMCKIVPKLSTKIGWFQVKIKTHGIYCSPYCLFYQGAICSLTGEVLKQDNKTESGLRTFIRGKKCLEATDERN